ncbi:Lrp/AsnC family transcriptional regulator [Microvirga guangxiensis]|uniref:Lrp/AsnC family transcriptional regulator, regulator of ectoine-degradation genes n=1 Tax=Microvirga guangxiensis TaxID=549386 RepID=A0A1G5LGC2_9HYPH|nr:Lrp/AsnC family transcriptional regulator [Microvirga guangxiensis]SCZ11967.1 Lrp/AsnC family transcriptional regulator, regulator of ectoine-degradation genes [Microvirga guangxiensis]
MKLDKIDLKILAALQSDGRMTKIRLAEAVNLSPTACWERLSRLEKSGVIAGYSARINTDKFVRQTAVLVEIMLRSHQQSDFERFEEVILKEPAIVSCDATGGGVDYILRVVSEDIDAYQRLIDRLLRLELGIERYFTYVVTKNVKASDPLPNVSMADAV